jgi:DNA-binding transcriptional regulator GbsR (MarR family)
MNEGHTRTHYYLSSDICQAMTRAASHCTRQISSTVCACQKIASSLPPDEHLTEATPGEQHTLWLL